MMAILRLVGSHGSLGMLRVAGAALGFVATILVSRTLGPAQAGLLYGLMAWVYALAILARWGERDLLLVVLPRLAGPRGSEVASRAIRAATLRAALVSLPAGVILGMTVYDDAPLTAAGLLVCLVVTTTLLQLLSTKASAREAPRRAVSCEFAAMPLVVLIWFAASEPRDWSEGALAYLAGTTLAAAAMAASTPRLSAVRAVTPLPDRPERARDFALAEIATFANAQAVMLVLPWVVSNAEVGSFNLALRIVSAIALPVSTVVLLLMPRLAVAHGNGDFEGWRRARREAGWLMITAGIVFIGFVLLAGEWLLSLAGNDYVAATGEVTIMGVLMGIAIMAGPAGAALSSVGRQDIYRRATVLVAVGSVIALLPVCIVFGTQGAAWLTGFAVLAQRLACLWMERQTIGPDLFERAG